MNTHTVPRHWMSCILVVLGLLSLFPLTLFAQNYDPYIAQTDMQPNPLLPLEFGGRGVFIFEVGNLGDDPLPFPQAAQANLMKLTSTLAFGLPDVADPTDPAQGKAALTGPLTDYFNFEYNPLNNTYTGIQKATIPGRSRFFGYIAYRVTENRFKTDPKPQCGAPVDISAPGYTNPQPEQNDFLSSYTYVEAKDYGDAPISYGEAYHYVDTTKNTSASPGPYYNRFFWLGSHIDSETNYTASADAKGDDNQATNGLYGVNQDDEDGVTFPLMIPGTTVSIPVSWTFATGSDPSSTRATAYLSAWIDWNGDGVFDDDDGSLEVVSHSWDYSETAGEYAWVNKMSRRNTSLANLSVTVPANAVVDRPIFARFRVSTTPKLSPTGMAPNGEVEDYQILLAPVTIGSYIWNDTNQDGIQDSGEPALAGVPVILYRITNLGEGVLATNEVAAMTTDASGLYSFTTAPGTFFVRVNAPDGYAFSPLKVGQDPAKDSDFGRYTPFTPEFTLEPGQNALHLDAGLYYAPTLSVITSFSAYTRDGQVFVAWESAAEYDTMGYWIERQVGEDWVRLSGEDPVWSQMSGGPASYELADAGATPGKTYTWRIIEIEGNGTENLYGPYTVTVDGAAADYDSWAAGINWNGAASGRHDDSDGDGLTNFEEFLAGTDPLNANSVLKITSLKFIGNTIEIRWASVAGRVYAVEHAKTLGGSWLPVTLKAGIVAEGDETSFVLPGADSGFFRVVLIGEE